jgi:hypothetical protein
MKLLQHPIISKVLSKKDLFFFTVLRYFEFGTLAFIYFHLAHFVPSEEYGKASRSFMSLTYSAFLVLGVNQVLVKHFSISKSDEEKYFFLGYNFLYNLVFSFVLLCIMLLIIEQEYRLNVAIIGAGKILQEGFVSMQRVKGKIFRINIIYLSNVVPLALIYFLSLENYTVDGFFSIWSVTILLSVVIGLIFNIKNIFTSFLSLDKFMKHLRSKWVGLIGDGIKLAMIGVLAPIVSTLDRFILSFIDFDKSALGSLQLADNIANVISLGLGSIIFIITPNFIGKLNKGELANNRFYFQGLKLFSGLFVLLYFLLILASPLLKYVFHEYANLTTPLFLYSSTRFLISGLFMYNIITVSKSVEWSYIKILATGTSFYLVLLVSLFIAFEQSFLYYLIPLAGLLTMIFIHFLTYRNLALNSFYSSQK